MGTANSKRAGGGRWTKRIDKRKVERAEHVKLSALDHEDRAAFRHRVETVAATREAWHVRNERDEAGADAIPRGVSVVIRWMDEREVAHVLIDLKG